MGEFAGGSLFRAAVVAANFSLVPVRLTFVIVVAAVILASASTTLCPLLCTLINVVAFLS